MLEHIVGIGVKAEQLCYLAAQIHDALADLEVVLWIVVSTLGVLCHIQLLAEVTLCGVGHERRVAGVVEGEDPAFHVFFFRVLCCCLHGGVGQSVELCFVGDV